LAATAADIAVYQYRTVFFSFADGAGRAGLGASGFGTMKTRHAQVRDIHLREMTGFSRIYPAPLSIAPRRHAVPVLACNGAGSATGTTGLIEIKKYLHGLAAGASAGGDIQFYAFPASTSSWTVSGFAIAKQTGICAFLADRTATTSGFAIAKQTGICTFLTDRDTATASGFAIAQET
jgi:hypothetical protein